MREHTLSGLGWMAKGRFLCVAALLAGFMALASGAWAATTNYVLTDGTNGNTATTSVTAAVPPANNTTSVAGAATYASINGDNGAFQTLNGGVGAIEAVQLVLTIGETPADITSIDVMFSGYATAAGNLNLYVWNGATWTSLGTMALTTADTTPTPVNFAGSFASYVIGGKMYLQYVLPAAANTDLSVDYVAVNVNYSVPVPNNSLIHNSISTASTKWPTLESGKAVAGWGIPNAQYGEFTCATCHARNTGNIKRIKTSLTAPTDTFPIQAASGTINFQSTSGANSFGDDGRAVLTSSSMICEGCHSKTAVHRFNSSSITDFNHKNANQTDCISCHPHKAGFKPLACDSCHGYPPTTLAGLVTGTDATGSTTFGAHQRHAVTLGYACENCHTGYVMPNNGDIDIHFSNFGSTTGTYTGQTTATYNGVAGTGGLTCNAVYCHSNGQSADGTSATPVYSAPTWTGSAGCGSCHANAPTTGSHASHVADATTECADCHTGAVEATTPPTTGHIDRVINVDTSAYTKAGAPGNGYGTCTASCHNTGRNGGGLTGTWGTTLNNCSECHPTVPATGGHGKHVGVSFAGVAMNCDDCHTGAVEGTTAPTTGHRDTNIDAVGYATANKALGSAFTNCTTASCHQDGLIGSTHYVPTPAWDVDTANCTQCHAAVPATGSHAAHVTTAGKDCSACHTGATKDTAYAGAAHGDLNIDVAVGGYAANKAIATAYTGCTNLACHSDGMAASGNAPVWGTDSNCAACHLSNMATGSHDEHLAAGSLCGDCHDGAVKDSNAGTAHTDGNVDVTATYATPNAAYGSATWTTCSAASCHDDGRTPNVSPTWGSTPVNSCLACHETIPSTGSHASHVADATTECTDCHTGAVEGTTAPTAGHRDTNIDVDAGGYPTNRAKTSAFTNCTTASCHNTGRNSGGLTDVWGTTLNNCSECHPTVPATAGHATHLGKNFAGVAMNCDDCHTGAVEGTTAPTAGHRDTNIDAVGYATANKALGTAYTNCTTASCHQNGLVSSTNYVATPNWDLNTANCTQCHAAVPATGSHAKHVTTAGKDCSACHTGATKDVSYDSTAHGDLNIDVAVGGYAANKVIATAYTNCTNLACHSDGMTATGNAPVWGNSLGCAACHLSNMTTGSHAKHLVEADCGACHADAVKDTTAPTGGVHADGNVDVYNATPLDMGYPVDRAYGSATWTTCTAASCHDQGRGGLATTPAWGVAKTDCTECHAGATITTGSHAAHLAAGSTCASCHDDATNPATETDPAAGHRDTNIDTDLALGYTQDKTKDSAFTTCATASCHNDGRNNGLTGTWGNTMNNCSECHPTIPTTAAHAKHVTSQTISSTINCAACHTGTTQGTTAGAGHRDGNIDVTIGAYPADKALGSAYTNCTTSYCHSNGKGTFQSVSWSATSTGCDFCHGNPPAGTHSVGDTDCSSCHNHVAAADNSFSNAALHINNIIEAQADDCTTCHGAGKSRDPEATDPDHKAHTSMAVMLSGKTISGNDFGNSAWWYGVSYDASSKPLMGCGQCHPADVSLHKNSVVNTKLTAAGEAGIPATNAKRNNGAAAIFSAGKCSAVYCHGDGINDGTYPDSPTWDLTLGNAGINCASCHGNSPATNAHGLHAVGIHYDTLYDDDANGLMPSAAAPATDAGAAHGNSATADTIGCQSCHNSTVTVEYNAGNSVCSTCHSDSNAPVTGNELAIIAASSSAHLDGATTVAFSSLTGFKSKAQVRSDITTVAELNASWTRTNNYKAATGTSHDAGKAVVPGWNSGAKTCSTVDCHNGILTPAWGTVSAAGNCSACHTNLP